MNTIINDRVNNESPRLLLSMAHAGRMASAGLVLAGLLFSPWAVLAQEAEKPDAPANLLDDHKLVEALRAGGYVIYFRHGATDLSTNDTDRDHLENCATQRLLSKAGRRQMRDIGTAVKALHIPVASVLSSPYCRNLDTARLAFGKAQAIDDLVNTVTADEETAARKAVALKKLLATPPAAGTNTVLSGHSGNLQEATGIWPKPEGVAIVFKPEKGGQFSYVARIPPTQWQQWARK